MKKYCVLLIKIMFSLTLSAQAKDSIKYVLCDKVEIAFVNYIENYEKVNGSEIDYCLLLKKELDNHKLSIIPFVKKEDKLKISWINRTNRFILLRDKYYPVLFDYDMSFGIVDKSIGSFTKRDGRIKRIYITGENYSVTFNSKGFIVSSGY